MGISSNIGEPAFADVSGDDILDIYDPVARRAGKTTVAAISTKIAADVLASDVLETLVGDAITAALTAAFAELPGTDPEEAGAIWNDGGVLKISAGA